MTTERPGPLVGAAVVRRALQKISTQLVGVRTGQVVSNNSVPAKTLVRLDDDPTNTPVRAWALDRRYPQGTRVFMLAYQPRGLIVIGSLDLLIGGADVNHSGAFLNSDSATLTTYTDTALTITKPIPASRIVTVHLDASLSNNTAPNSTRLSFDIRENDAAGASLIGGSSDDWSAVNIAPNALMGSAKMRTFALGGTASTMYVVATKRVSGGTGTYQDMNLVVIPSP